MEEEVLQGTTDGIGTSEPVTPTVHASSALLLAGADLGAYDIVRVLLTPLTEQVVQVRRHLSVDSLRDGYTPLHQLLGAALRHSEDVWYVMWLATRSPFTQDFREVPFLAAYELDAVSICESVLANSMAITVSAHATDHVAEYTMLHKTTITYVPTYRTEKLRELGEVIRQFEKREAVERTAVEARRRATMDDLLRDMQEQRQLRLQQEAQRMMHSRPPLGQQTDVSGIPGGRVDAPAAAEARTGEPHE